MACETKNGLPAYGDVDARPVHHIGYPDWFRCLVHFLCNLLLTLAAAVPAHDGHVALNPGSGPVQGKNTGLSQDGRSGGRHEPYKHAASNRARTGRAGWPARGDCDDGGSKATGKSKRRGAANGLLLACPRYKHNPILHLDCLLRNRLTDTCFVVQHLVRGHPTQPIHCPVCGQTFATRVACDHHILSRSCQTQDFHYEGLTQDQINQLRQPRRTQTEVQRWYSIWDILYPNVPRPDSPYVGGPLEEIVDMARRLLLWNSRNDALLSEFLIDGPQPAQAAQPGNATATIGVGQLAWSYLQSIIPQQDDLSFLTSDGVAGDSPVQPTGALLPATASASQQLPPQPPLFSQDVSPSGMLPSGQNPVLWDDQWPLRVDFASYPNPSEGFVSTSNPSFINMEPTATPTTDPTSLRPDEDLVSSASASAEANGGNKQYGRLADGAVGNSSLGPSGAT